MLTKMEPLINDQSRSIVALADALDDLTMKEQEALINPQAESGGPAPEPAKEVQAPEPRRKVQAPEPAQDLRMVRRLHPTGFAERGSGASVSSRSVKPGVSTT
ncbi:hypothetical protein GPALN_002977 [Globodera pallida]|nr:hypothetical protein GPALN_002977 [Globodera pallida]